MKLKSLLLLVLFFASGLRAETPTTAPATEPQAQSLPSSDLKIGSHTFKLQVAANYDQRETGLMYVHSMPADEGMIFVFPQAQELQFWMKNTLIDLDIIYVNSLGRITAIKTMKAGDETPISSDEPADIAIELKAGVARQTGLVVGDKLDIPQRLRSKAR